MGGAQSYRKFFRFTVSYIRIRANTDLALFAWSPNFPFDDKAIEYFPGADVVDVIGLDVYDIGEPNSPSWPEFKESVTAMGRFAHTHGKVAAVTETGNRRRSPEQLPSWWCELRDAVLECQLLNGKSGDSGFLGALVIQCAMG